jgi:hypothetical protein
VAAPTTIRRVTADQPPVLRPIAAFVVDPPEPAAGEPVRLLDLSYDPGGEGIALHAWDLGDGTTSTESCPEHRFEADGTYEVRLHVTAADGRLGATSSPVRVTTHDIALLRIVAPAAATVDDRGEVVVVVTSRHGPEIVQVELLRSRGSGAPEPVAVHTRSLPEAGELEIGFPVTFADADLAAGEVTFHARASLVGAADRSPENNELAAPPTLVTRHRAASTRG